MADTLGEPSGGLMGLDTALALGGLGLFETWVRYFSQGGRASPLELDAFLNSSLAVPDREYNIVANVLNERLIEIGVSPLVPMR